VAESASSTPMRPSTPRSGASKQPASAPGQTPRRSPLDAAAGSTVPLLHASASCAGGAQGPTAPRRSVHGVVIPLLKGLGHHASPRAAFPHSDDTFHRFVSPSKGHSDERNAGGGDLAEVGEKRATVLTRATSDSDSDFEHGVPRRRQHPAAAKQREALAGAASPQRVEHITRGADDGMASAPRPPPPQRPAGLLFAQPTCHGPAGMPLAARQGPPSARANGALSTRSLPLGLLFTTPAQEVENLLRVEENARRLDVDAPEALGFAGIAAEADSELKLHRERALAQSRALQQQQQQQHAPTTAATAPVPTLPAQAEKPMGHLNVSTPPPVAVADVSPPPQHVASPARPAAAPTVRVPAVCPVPPAASVSPASVSPASVSPASVPPASVSPVGGRMGRLQRRLGDDWLAFVVYGALAAVLGVVLIVLDDFIDQFRV
jgi:hypothetical protein